MSTNQKMKFVTCCNPFFLSESKQFCSSQHIIFVWVDFSFWLFCFLGFFTKSSSYTVCSSEVLFSFWGHSEPGISQHIVVQTWPKGQIGHELWKSVNGCPRSKQLFHCSMTVVFMCIYFPRKKLYFILKIFFSHYIGSGTIHIFNTHGLSKHVCTYIYIYICTLAIIKSKPLQSVLARIGLVSLSTLRWLCVYTYRFVTC